MASLQPATLPLITCILSTTCGAAAAAAQAASGCNPQYTKAQKLTYGIDDGGCYFCTKGPGNQMPLEGEHLAQHCRMICNSDPLCVAYTVARPAVLEAHNYYYGKKANCCLERAEFPDAVFVGVTKETVLVNNCQRDAMCWRRYEKNKGQDSPVSKQQCPSQTSRPSNLCTAVWEPTEYSDEEVKVKADFIAGGCTYNDEAFTSLLEKAHKECLAEEYAESVTVTVVALPSATYVHTTILDL